MKFLFPAKKSKYFDIVFNCLKEGLENQGHSIKGIAREDLTEKIIKKFDFTSEMEEVTVIAAGGDEGEKGGSTGFELPGDRCQEALAGS